MSRLIACIFFVMLHVTAFSQERIKPPTKGLDTIPWIVKVDVRDFPVIHPKAVYNTVDSVLFELDSITKPFYNLRYNTISKNSVYRPKYRISVNTLTRDTSYIPIPKTETYIAASSRLKFDTLKVDNTIKPIFIDTMKVASDPVWWAFKNSFSLNVTEAAFLNWNAGGNNSISALLQLSFDRDYKRIYTLWKNKINIRYGINSREDEKLRKTDDRIDINSTFGYRTDSVSNWYYSVKFNFRTQFTDGFRYPNTDKPISRFFAPAYLFLGAGAQYELKKKQLSMYFSPVTLKSTIVNDETLSNEGAFGVEKGKKSRNEFGFLIQGSWDTQLVKNVIMKNNFTLYSDYLRKFGNTDVRYDLIFDFIINKYMKANLAGHIIYDDDIKYKEDIDNDGILDVLGPRVQLKQLLSIGVAFNF